MASGQWPVGYRLPAASGQQFQFQFRLPPCCCYFNNLSWNSTSYSRTTAMRNAPCAAVLVLALAHSMICHMHMLCHVGYRPIVYYRPAHTAYRIPYTVLCVVCCVLSCDVLRFAFCVLHCALGVCQQLPLPLPLPPPPHTHTVVIRNTRQPGDWRWRAVCCVLCAVVVL
jgi:hypothetical protein